MIEFRIDFLGFIKSKIELKCAHQLFRFNGMNAFRAYKPQIKAEIEM